MSRAQKWINRLSFWVLYLWGQLYFIRDGGAYLLDGKVIGYSWYNYLRQAWLIERRISRHYNYFREPLYGGIIGEFGELTGSYADVAILVSSLSGSLTALFLGLGIWHCFPKHGGFWGGFTALSMFLSAGFLPVGRWGNHYTLLILGMALIFWSLFRAIQRSGGWIWVGLSLGAASSIDQRVFPWLLLSIFLCFISTKGWISRIGHSLPILIGGLGIPRFFRWYFAEDSKHRLSFDGVLQFQREVVSRWALGDVGARTTTCSFLPESAYLRPAFFGTDCSWEIIAWNWQDKIPAFSVFPLSWLVIAIVSLLLMAILKSSRRFLGKWLLLTAILGMVFFWSALMPLPPRYLPSTCVGLGLILPFFLGVLDEKRRGWILRIFAILSALYFCYFGSNAFDTRKEIRRQVREQQEYWQVWQVVQRYQEQGSFLDCGEKGLNSLILPRSYVALPFHQLKNSSECEEWIEEGKGDWVLVGFNSALQLKVEKLKHWKLYYRSRELNFSLWKFEGPN